MPSADGLIARAALESGLPVRGQESFRPGLDRILDAFSRATTLTMAGRGNVESLVIATLKARLRVEDWIVHHPEVLEKPIVRPVFILGMPRAGTTFLVNLMSLDPARRVYWSWEGWQEIPPAEAAHLHDDPRIAYRRAEVDAALSCGALDHRFHVEMADEPGECTVLLSQDFKSNVWMSQTLVPDYVCWLLDKADMDSAYCYEKRVLQVLQSRAPGKWTLKLPGHVLFLDSLMKVFPDARIVVTHRDPAKVIASSCAASRNFLKINSTEVSDAVLGRETLMVIEKSVERLAAERSRRPFGTFHDLHYSAFVSDPMGEIAKLYAFLGDELTAYAEARMRRGIADHHARRATYGIYQATLEEFGLTRSAVDEKFSAYVADYKIQRE